MTEENNNKKIYASFKHEVEDKKDIVELKISQKLFTRINLRLDKGTTGLDPTGMNMDLMNHIHKAMETLAIGINAGYIEEGY